MSVYLGSSTLVLAFALTSFAAEPPRVDRYGDPLPEGAIARLGTTRFRPSFGYSNSVVSRDGKMIATSDDWMIQLWDRKTGKELWSKVLGQKDHTWTHGLLFSFDGQRLMVIRGDYLQIYHQMVLLDTESGKIVQQISPKEARFNVDECGFLFNGKQFLTPDRVEFRRVTPGSETDGTIPIVWNLETGQQAYQLPRSTQSALSPDGRHLATAFGNVIRVCDLTSGKVTIEFECPIFRFKAFSWSADSKTLAVRRNVLKSPQKAQAEDSKEPQSHINQVFWDVATRKERRSWDFSAWQSVLSPDGKHAAAIDYHGQLQVREIDTGKDLSGGWILDNWFLRHFSKKGVWDHWHLAFTSKSTLLISHPPILGLRHYDLDSGRCLCRSAFGHLDCSRLQLIEDGKTIVTSGPFQIQDVETGEDQSSLGHHEGAISSIAFSPEEKILLSHDSRGGVRVWDTIKGELLPTPLPKIGCVVRNHRLGFLDAGRTVVAVTADLNVYVWDARTGKLTRRFSVAEYSKRHHFQHVGLLEFGLDETCLSLSADNRWLAINWENEVAVWDVAIGQHEEFLSGFNDTTTGSWGRNARSVNLGVGGKSVLVENWENYLVQTRDGKHRWKFSRRGSNGASTNLTLSPNGKWFSAMSEKFLTVYEISTGKECWSIPKGKASEEWLLSFTADSSCLATIANDETITLRDSATGKEIRRIEPSQGENNLWDSFDIPWRGPTWGIRRDDVPRSDFRLYSAQLGKLPPEYLSRQRYICSPDNRILAFGRYDSIGLIEARTGSLIARFQAPHRGDISCLLFGSDSRTLITGRSDSSILLWDWPAAAKLKPEPNILPGQTTWDALGDEDAGTAYRAIFTLTAHPDEAIALLREQLKPAQKEESGRIEKLIRELDDNRYSVRDKANKSLLRLGESAAPFLREALKQPLSFENEQRVRGLLASSQLHKPGKEARRQLRAIQALRWINTPDSRMLLQELAKGKPNAALTKEAQAAFKR